MTGSIQVNGRQLVVDEDGYLMDTSGWDADVALALARSQEGLAELSQEHWTVLHFIRAHFVEHQTAPVVRAICKATGIPLVRIYELFPSGPTRGACKVAGLPKPDTCA